MIGTPTDKKVIVEIDLATGRRKQQKQFCIQQKLLLNHFTMKQPHIQSRITYKPIRALTHVTEVIIHLHITVFACTQ